MYQQHDRDIRTIRARKDHRCYGMGLGIIILDDAYPGFPGDVRNASAYPFPIQYEIARDVDIHKLVVEQDKLACLESLVRAAQNLEKMGCRAIATECGYFAYFQREVAASVSVPVFTSSLLQVPFAQQLVGPDRVVGILMANARSQSSSIASIPTWAHWCSNAPAFRPLRALCSARLTFRSLVVQELWETILARQFEPGEFLPSQKDLAAQFDVGLSTIHEAIQVLAALGLVESHPGKGTWVRQDATTTLLHPTAVKTRLGELDARQLLEACTVIEVGLAKLAAQRATREDLQQIREAMRAMEAAPDNERFVQADIEFHLAVARAGHNGLLEQFYHVARELLSEVAIELISLPTVKEDSMPLQAAVAKAIEQHDVRKADKAALAHMKYIEGLLDKYE